MLTREQVKTLRESGREFLAADAMPMPPPNPDGPESADDENRTVDVCWFTGIDVPRMDWWTGDIYTLRLPPEGADLSLLNADAPVLDHHQSYDGACGSQKGKVVRAWMAQDGRYLATLRFSRRPDCDGLWMDIRDGIATKFSMGVELLETMEQRDAAGKLTMKTATKWRPFEISTEPIPADFGTTSLSAEVPAAPAAAESAASAGRPAEPTRATAQLSKEVPVMDPEINTGGDARTEQLNAEALRAEGAQLEATRRNGIEALAAPFLKEKSITADFVATLTGNPGVTVDKARGSILETLARRAEENPINGNHQAGLVTRDARDSKREQMEASLFVRANPAAPKEIQDKGRDFAGFTLVDLSRECLVDAGVKTRGMSRDEIARVALYGRNGAAEYFAGAMTTSDLPNILANVANKTLRQAYEAAPRTFTAFCRMVTASDFKPVNRVMLSDIAALQKTNEKGEFQRVYVSDSKETYSLTTWGGIVPITRKVVVNDDLQALTRIPAGLGVAAANLESDTVWAVITSNAVMADGTALFHANHSNLNGTAALALDKLGAARAAMRKQTAPKGTILNLTPRFLIVPAALEQAALQLVYPVGLAATAATGVVPQWVQSLVPVVEPRLDAVLTVGATNWFMSADPATIDTIEYCYLEGQQGVYIETRQGFEVDGVEIKARLDFAAAAIDYRGMCKNTAA